LASEYRFLFHHLDAYQFHSNNPLSTPQYGFMKHIYIFVKRESRNFILGDDAVVAVGRAKRM
jgi:hypothetical protein